jgi:hypothetical protein
MTRPILTDDQLDIIHRLAEPLHPHDHAAFYEAVAEMLNGCSEIGDGVVSRAAREAQRRFFDPPQETPRALWRKPP